MWKMTQISTMHRRDFLAATSAAIALGFTGLRRVAHGGTCSLESVGSYGPLQMDPAAIIDLPKGFTYSVFSTHGQEMDDGLLVPGLHDGMAAFPAGDGTCLLVRNHEIGTVNLPRFGAFGWQNERLAKVDQDKLYDHGAGGDGPALGGTTTVLYDLERQQAKAHWLSLGGTGINCAGGPTPWNSWLSCEEWTQRADVRHARDHGFVFEVPATESMSLVKAEPIRAMGRFQHEAVAVDPETSIIYQTEDRQDGAIYRYLPRVPGKPIEGGRLQALAIADSDGFDTRNWNTDGTDDIMLGQTLPVRWIDMDDVEAPSDDLRYRAFAEGAARFARGEGIWRGNGAFLWVCTTGGQARLGQVFSYTPSPYEGTDRENTSPGTLALFIEPNDGSLIANADNLTIARNGDVFLCEDGGEANGMARVTPEGAVERFALNRMNASELAGACFSPDGSTLFVNIQRPGISLAIRGPWLEH